MANRKSGAELAQEFMQMVNLMGNETEQQAFVDGVLNDHRTLQQSAAGVFLQVFAGWAEMKDTGYYDLRNEATVTLGKSITEAASGAHLPFV